MPPEKEMIESASAPSQAIVAFIDILGYGSLVKKLTNNLEAIKAIENVLQKTSVGLLEAMKSKLSVPEPYDEYSRKLVHAINVRFISDTILVTLHFAKTTIPFPDFNEKEILTHCIFAYLRFIGMFSTMFIGKTGLVLRGGITIGPHYENQHNASLFIFSQAYLKAHELEKKAELSRILIGDELCELLKNLPLEEMGNFFYDGDKGEKCLDIYAHLEHDSLSRSILEEIKRGVSYNLLENREEKRALEKLIDFVKFHNRKVCQLGFTDLVINISKFEQHFHTL